jgi:hypothetical protein
MKGAFMWTDDEIETMMLPVGHAEYAAMAYAEAVEIGQRMRDEAQQRIAELEAEIVEWKAMYGRLAGRLPQVQP